MVFPPIPPNQDLLRGMFVQIPADSSLDPLSNPEEQQELLHFCGQQGVNQLYLEIYTYLSPSNTTIAKVNRLRQFIQTASASGIEVWALSGHTDWAINQPWVQRNIVLPIKAFNIQGTHQQKLKGILLNVDYWSHPYYSPNVHCPKLCDMMNHIRRIHQLAVGCFAVHYLKDSTGDRVAFSYQGKTAQDGEFLMDNADVVIVGAYRNHALNNKKDGPGQIALYQPWYDYASQIGKNMPISCASETI
jgi:hypothetical protein